MFTATQVVFLQLIYHVEWPVRDQLTCQPAEDILSKPGPAQVTSLYRGLWPKQQLSGWTP